MEFAAFMKEKKRLTSYCGIFCQDCKFSNVKGYEDICCTDFIMDYPEEAERILQEWIEEDRESVDWTTVPVDTLIETMHFGRWIPRYFSRYENNKVYAWSNGTTSKTAGGADYLWDKARLYKKEEK